MSEQSLFERNIALTLLFVLTFLYLFLVGYVDRTDGFAVYPMTAFIGIFVPAAYWTSLLTFGFAPVLAIIICHIFDRVIRKTSLSTIKKAGCALILLFALTTIFDTKFFYDQVSIKMLLRSVGILEYRPPHCC